MLFFLFPVFMLFAVGNVLAISSHQFRFGSSNIVYGNVPHSIHIVGYWTIRPNDERFASFFQKNFTLDRLKGDLYLCKHNVERKMFLINSRVEDNKFHRLQAMLFQKEDVRIQPYIDTNGCEILETKYDQITLKDGSQLEVRRFDVHHNFTDHSPILFIDAFGVAAFHHRPKISVSQNLLYCENEDLTFPVIFNKRPVCPRAALETTKMDQGMVTIYKPNIMSIERKAYHCYIKYSVVKTFQNFLSAAWNNLPLTEIVKPIEPERCQMWLNSRKCNINGLTFDHLSDFNHTFETISDTRLATVNPIVLKYRWMFDYKYTIANCIIDIGYVRVTPPFMNMKTPWTTMSNEYLYKSNYTRAGGEVILWDKFEKEDLCNYVPMKSFDAKRITYETKDFVEEDPRPKAREMYHFVSDAERSVYASDDTQITSHDKYNCITVNGSQTLYMVSNGMILSWQNGSSIRDNVASEEFQTQQVYHAHYGFSELTEIFHTNCSQNNCSKIFAVPAGVETDKQESCKKGKACEIPEITSTFEKRSSPKHIHINETEKSAPLHNVVAYLQYKFESIKNEETIRHAQAWCENQQHMYDNQLILSRIVPSQIISSYLNRPVKAEFIGNGVFNTHYCEIVSDFIVVDSLMVNNTDPAPKFGGETFKQLYEKAGVNTALKNLCFVMPIIIFRHDSALEQFRIGQLHHDQSISTLNMPFVEECKFGRQFFHAVGKDVHVFENYKKVSQTSLDDLYDHASRLAENDAYLKQIDESGSRPSIEPLLENTQFVDIYTKFEPTKLQRMFLRFDNTDIYGYRQKRKIISSFEDLVAYSNQARLDESAYQSRKGPTVTSNPYMTLEDAGDGFKFLVDNVAEGINYVIDGGESVVGNLLNTAGSTMDDVADFFTGGFLKVIIILVAIAGVGVLIYVLVKQRLLKDDHDDQIYYTNYAAIAPNYSRSYPQEIKRRFNNNQFIQEF